MKLTRTQKERIKRFIAALRSGKYKQGKGRLRQDNRFCCLGVACDVSKRSLRADWDLDSFLGENLTLPDEVVDYYGFTSDDPILDEYNAAGLNDGAFGPSFTFKKIATFFEKEYLSKKKGKQ